VCLAEFRTQYMTLRLQDNQTIDQLKVDVLKKLSKKGEFGIHMSHFDFLKALEN